jgi:hypothetical protein
MTDDETRKAGLGAIVAICELLGKPVTVDEAESAYRMAMITIRKRDQRRAALQDATRVKKEANRKARNACLHEPR